jgi:hypothetical protein
MKKTDEALILGAEYRVLNEDCSYSTVKIASLYEPELASLSQYGCMRYMIRRLIDMMPSGFDSIKFRSKLSRISDKRRYKEEFNYAEEKGIELKLLRKEYESDAFLLLEDAERRKTSITETI